MPYVKPISGHTDTGGVRRYLVKDGRALASDYINLDVPSIGIDDELPDNTDFDWAAAMDETRREYGNNIPWKNREARTYKHYIFSPDPGDRIDLESLRKLTVAWALENFSNYEVAIVYHDDNEGHIPHAHVVVNNTNLSNGRRLRDESPRTLKRSAQRLAKEMGYSSLDDPKRAAPPRQRQGREKAPRTYQKVYRRKAEAEIESKGEYSWVSDIRARVSVARAVARSEGEFRKVLDLLGIDVRDNSPKAARRDWVYSLQDHPTWRIGGEKLGLIYGKESIEQRLSLGGAGHLPSDVEKRIVDIARGAYELKNVGELKRLSNVIAVCDRYGVASVSDLEAVSKRLENASDAACVNDALQFARESEVLPKSAKRTSRTEPQRIQGQRGEWHIDPFATTRGARPLQARQPSHDQEPQHDRGGRDDR